MFSASGPLGLVFAKVLKPQFEGLNRPIRDGALNGRRRSAGVNNKIGEMNRVVAVGPHLTSHRVQMATYPLVPERSNRSEAEVKSKLL